MTNQFNDSLFILFIVSLFRLSVPLVFAAYGAYFSEKSGTAQIAIESFLLVGAFSAATTAFYSSSLLTSLLLSALITFLFAQIFCWLVLKMKTNSIVAGTGMNLLAMGLIPIISKVIFNSTGSTPQHQLENNTALILFLLFLSVTFFVYWISEKTVWGLQMKFAAEKKEALACLGISSVVRQWQSISVGAFISGLGGAILSLFMSSSYSPLMSAGRGFMALAALIFAGWNLKKTVLICFLFGGIEALQIQLQSNAAITTYIPTIILQLFPYIATLIALLIFKDKTQPPAELS